MSYQVTMADVEARPTVVVPATTTWQEFPTLWRELSAGVWACLHAGGITRSCRNIMLYWMMCHMSRLESSCSSRAHSLDK